MVREINEDSYLDRPDRKLWAVADGMGGHSLGDFASQLVIDRLQRQEALPDLERFVGGIRQSLLAVNQQLRQEATIRDAHIIGSTVVVLLAGDPVCTCLWAGDSRIYLYRNSSLRQLTRDHNQIEDLLARGELRPGDIANYPARNMITRAVGAMDTLILDEETITVSDGDMFLLCSDGLSNEVSAIEIGNVLRTGHCRQAAEKLVDLALRHGGRDNVTAVVVRAEDPDNTDKTTLNPAL